MTFKKLIGKLHLWLGLASGLIVFIVSITGCLYVFQREIFEVVHRDAVFITPPAAAAQPLPYSVIWQKAQAALGQDQQVYYANAYRAPDRAWSFMTYKGTPGKPYFGGQVEVLRSAYVNPYTGQITGIIDNKTEFFQLVKSVHWDLLLGDAGRWVVSYSTLTFVLMLLSGLVLWWPKNKAARKQRFKIKWDASGKRLNYDLHNTVGFYVTLVSLVIALTGLTWSFDWVRNGITYLATGHTADAHGGKGGKGGKKGMSKEKPAALSAADQALADQTLNAAVRDAWQRIPAAVLVSAKPLTSLKDPLTVRVNEGEGIRFRSDQLTYDARTGAFQKAELYRDKPGGEQFIGMNYDIHVGAILGWPTKILAFVASLVCATLPVTGFFIWWNRLKKNKKPHRQPASKVAVEQAVAA
ncbi:MAG TPA: PepSY-associated TM helix domain-containing protein [Hymenobacter sp.]|uniref:PepSY-associated TM helix domain-containing protein n=1 Tax=Hymenobacter sp. TaxID=1898978 RepID=UPI002D7E794E|nr:PepSY-associated TM helix domain-containing protein [Hymenobacter sp.]HET9502473.1 PepSY-associated TM helix domain-containing protein [Hymenobacter sp.]